MTPLLSITCSLSFSLYLTIEASFELFKENTHKHLSRKKNKKTHSF